MTALTLQSLGEGSPGGGFGPAVKHAPETIGVPRLLQVLTILLWLRAPLVFIFILLQHVGEDAFPLEPSGSLRPGLWLGHVAVLAVECHNGTQVDI